MALKEIPMQLQKGDLPKPAAHIIEESDRRIDALFSTAENKKTPNYLPSDPDVFYRALAYLTENDLTMGNVFCEWGSGFGVCTCLAASLGYDAYGIEIEGSLVEASEDLATHLGVEVSILETSYIPEGYESYSGVGGEYLIREDYDAVAYNLVSELAYEGMGCDISDIDVFFVYPWPYQQQFMQELFEEIAVEGAILLAYHKSGEIYAYRKVGSQD